MQNKNELLRVVKQLCREAHQWEHTAISKWYLDKGDSCCVNVGIVTRQIAARMGVSTATARYHLDKLKQEGRLLKRTIPGGSCLWWPVGMADVLKNGVGRD